MNSLLYINEENEKKYFCPSKISLQSIFHPQFLEKSSEITPLPPILVMEAPKGIFALHVSCSLGIWFHLTVFLVNSM